MDVLIAIFSTLRQNIVAELHMNKMIYDMSMFRKAFALYEAILVKFCEKVQIHLEIHIQFFLQPSVADQFVN